MSLQNNPFSLEDRVAVVTGGASGIGAGIVDILAQMGATVVIADIDLDAARTAAGNFSDRGFNVIALQVDLSDETSINALCPQVIAAAGNPWILVNNAGLQDRQEFLQATAAEWERMNTVNARAPFLLTREFARAMIAVGEGGRIINIASAALSGSIVYGLVAYTGSKGALLGVSKATAFELAPHNITVNTILPGAVPTPGAIAAKGPAPQGPARRELPLGMCDASDIGAAVAYFASPAARRVSNQVLAVDGGFSVT